jgi:hypothetical protein
MMDGPGGFEAGELKFAWGGGIDCDRRSGIRQNRILADDRITEQSASKAGTQQ